MICHGTIAQSKYSTFVTINVTISEVTELGGGEEC